MFRSVATSLAFLPLLSSFITASQSTLVEAKAGRAANAIVVRSIAEAAASANFLVNIFFPAELGCFQTMHSIPKSAPHQKGSKPSFWWNQSFDLLNPGNDGWRFSCRAATP